MQAEQRIEEQVAAQFNQLGIERAAQAIFERLFDPTRKAVSGQGLLQLLIEALLRGGSL